MMERYVVAFGSNRRHPRHGRPASVIAAALREMECAGIRILCRSRTIASAPLGPSWRTYANAAAVVECGLGPRDLLERLQEIEVRLGRRRRGQRWRERVIDLDIALWAGGCWVDDALVIPHVKLRERRFVLAPACDIAPAWRDPLSGLSLRHLHARLTRPRAVPKPAPDRRRSRAGP